MGSLCARLLLCRPRFLNYECLPEDEDLLVQIKQGTLRGRSFRSKLTSLPYYGFLGIPYGTPPVGELRFQPAQPASSWYGTYNACYERNACQQVIGIIWFKKFIWGSEDCLYLNVYTPQNPSKITTPKAVMVFIHGGGFCLGSGSRKLYAPDFLINRDVIVVTINYRLHILGFLNLGLPECPGNVGMKDQTLALQWVKDNIAQFGGDPNNVTIFGESAGGSSVHYHLLSPLSKGLFHKAIMESGSALSPWGHTYNPLEQAFDIGKRCGYYGNDARELLAHLKNVSSYALTQASMDMILDQRQQYIARFNNIAPSVEAIKDGAFLPDYPCELAKIATPVPAIFGVNDKEGMLLFMNVMSRSLISRANDDFSIILKHNFKINERFIPDLSKQIRRFYFGDEAITMENAADMIDLYTDLTGFYGYEAIDFLANSDTPPYVYEFAYNGNLNFLTRIINFVKRLKISGASHGDEIFYLFYPEMYLLYPKLQGGSLTMIDDMTLMWSNFAKTGNPSGRFAWTPSTAQNPRYLQIKDNIKMVEGKFYGRRLEFLKNLLKPVMDPDAKPWDIFDLLYLLGLHDVHF
ncbi:esterase E4-like [Planococcus citri]|uniref:esterase E4-like n=1 Tax=Planococcus citri TaxID=170843 RepID=UPI0031F96828